MLEELFQPFDDLLPSSHDTIEYDSCRLTSGPVPLANQCVLACFEFVQCRCNLEAQSVLDLGCFVFRNVLPTGSNEMLPFVRRQQLASHCDLCPKTQFWRWFALIVDRHVVVSIVTRALKVLPHDFIGAWQDNLVKQNQVIWIVGYSEAVFTGLVRRGAIE